MGTIHGRALICDIHHRIRAGESEFHSFPAGHVHLTTQRDHGNSASRATRRHAGHDLPSLALPIEVALARDDQVNAIENDAAFVPHGVDTGHPPTTEVEQCETETTRRASPERHRRILAVCASTTRVRKSLECTFERDKLHIEGTFLRCESVCGTPRTEQWNIDIGCGYELDAAQCLERRRQIHDGNRGQCARPFGQRDDRPVGTGCSGTERAEHAGPGIVHVRATKADDYATGTHVTSREEQLAHANARRPHDVGAELETNRLRGLDKCSVPINTPRCLDVGAQRLPDHGVQNRYPASRCDRMNETRTAVTERTEREIGRRSGARPSVANRAGGLGRGQRSLEVIGGDHNAHAQTVTAPCHTTHMFDEPQASPLALLLMGQEQDLGSERGVSCPGELPLASDPDLVERARAAKAALGDRVFVLGHHYQRDEVIQFADVTGDSFKLAQSAAARPEAEFIVFCGVHFMAESADILTSDRQRVILPDLAAGCSMADMAAIDQVEKAWAHFEALGVASDITPITYMNSTAAIKAFTGRNHGTVCTSSNAERALRWAFDRTSKIFFLPDQHLGRNTAVLQLGISLDDCVVYDPYKPGGGLTDEQIRDAKVILWRGHCSVHGRFSAENVHDVRKRIPGVRVMVHPECKHEVVTAADAVGSTEYIIQQVAKAPAGTAWAIGTELNLVRRLAAEHPEQQIVYLDKTVCYCSTMNRIDLPHLVWSLEQLVDGIVSNTITVDPDTTHWARVALDRMLALPATPIVD